MTSYFHIMEGIGPNQRRRAVRQVAEQGAKSADTDCSLFIVRETGVGRRRAFGASRRKDSGFSESFDDPETAVDGQDSPGTTSPPPTPPPRPPPRRTTDHGSTSPPLPRPPAPLPAATREHDDDDRCDRRPPTPPPRPPHTLPTFSSAGVH